MAAPTPLARARRRAGERHPRGRRYIAGHSMEGDSAPSRRRWLAHRELPRVALAAVAIAVGAWLAATACYRSDDYGLIAHAWAGGSPADALRVWWDQHFGAGLAADAWPKFHRPVWRALMLGDAHVLGCSPAA